MTDKELRKLSRIELLELLLEQSREVERLKAELKDATEKLASRELEVNEAGSIAGASLHVNGVFEASQKAADQYLQNIKRMSERQKEVCAIIEKESGRKAAALIADTKKQCKELENKTFSRCEQMVREAELLSNAYWDEVKARTESLLSERDELRAFLNMSFKNKR